MTFIAQDLYLTSGLVGSINNWQETVTKFDSSTFYNWEQDNMPVYDLEDRTDYLWERIGYPITDGFSGIPGKIFVVSSTFGFPVGRDSSGIVFRDLSSVINVLPNPLTFPVIIEVASFGNLGELNLNNIKIDDDCTGAGIEIINRGFARSKFGAAATPSAIYDDTDPANICVNSTAITSMLHNATSLALSSYILSATNDARLANSNRSWTVNFPYGNQTSPVTINSLLSQKPILSINSTTFDQIIGNDLYRISEYGSTQDPSINTYDVSVLDLISNSIVNRPSIQTNSNVAMLAYGNYLTSVKVNNCTGPIYIRGFCVDGALDTTGTGLVHSTESGFDIKNSHVTLENCMAIRCSKHGFKLVNSDVDVRRAIVAGRIYSPSSTTTSRETSSNGIGLFAENSVIDITPVNTAYVQYSGVDIISQFAFNDIGIYLSNSKIKGGNSITASFTTDLGPTMIQTMYNTKVGLEMHNSVLDHKGGFEIYNNYNGIKATKSELNIPLLTVENNQVIGGQFDDCQLKFNPELISPAVGNSYRNSQIGEAYKQFNFYRNGQHMVLDHSLLKYPTGTSLPTKIGNILAASSFGLVNVNSQLGYLPSIEVRNNSNVDLIHASVKTYQTTTSITEPSLGTCVSVKNNSKVNFKGSIGVNPHFSPTMLIGPTTLNNQKKSAVVYVGQNSMVEFNGNTLIAQGGVDILAEDSSVMTFSPQRLPNKQLDIASWDLSSNSNHTRVELHSTRACLVADNNSIINIEDLGDYSTHWGAAVLAGQDYSTDNNKYYTSGGYMQFYPNPQYDTIMTGTLVNPMSIGSYAYEPTFPGYFITSYTDSNSAANIHTFSRGGLCVKAQNGSKVNVLNAHFPAGWYNTSGYYYDASAGTCELLRIWNIGQGSELHASYCSVSGTYPSLTGYTGPSSVYGSETGLALSGAPSSTPDTSSLSILDYYGASGSRPANNYGPFRLYFSPHSQSKLLAYTPAPGGSGTYGTPYQALAQGFNPSGNLIGSSSFDRIYSGISISKFYYVSSMLDPSYVNRIRFDESAADMFSNSKHNAIAKSGRIPLVTIYRATTEVAGQGYDTNFDGKGRGFRSAEIFDIRRFD